MGQVSDQYDVDKNIEVMHAYITKSSVFFK